MHRFVSLLGLNFLIALSVGGAIFWILYDTAFDQISTRLLTTVMNHKELMVAVAAFDEQYSSDFPGGSRRATLSQVEAAQRNFESFGETGEFTIAEKNDGQIEFFYRQRRSGLVKPPPVSFDSKLAEPMRRALKGLTGTVVALDYSGESVLAAYTPVEMLNIGIVAKIDLNEIREPFIRAAAIGFMVSIILFGGSTFLFFRLASPINKELQESENLYRRLVEGQSELVCRSTNDGTITFANEAYCRYFGRSIKELVGSDFTRLIPEAQRGNVLEQLSRLSPTNRSLTHEHEVITAKGDVRWMQWTISLLLTDDGEPDEIISVGLDKTETKRASSAFQRVNRSRLVLMRAHEILIQFHSPGALLNEICRLLVEDGRYLLAWIGLAENDTEKTVRPIARCGAQSEFLDEVKITWDESPTGMGPTGIAIRTGGPVAFQNLATDPRYEAFRAVAMVKGFHSSAAIPLKLDHGKKGVLGIYSADPNEFDDEELGLLAALAEDISFGVGAFEQIMLRGEAEEKVSLGDIKHKEALLATISVLANTIERRDPYTAGHQRNVAELASAIGSRMGLSDDLIEGVRMGSIVHDIGKISVPAEILAKPGKLTQAEFDLVKSHAEIGYNIVKDIEFDWPIADMVRQHHERLDGSGYPSGLKGDEICLEARIIAVADVVDAIISHRPYRAGRSLDEAVSELIKNRTTWYDPKAVDACLTLIRKDGFFTGREKG